ncbi:MAG: sulfatase-like hydrolase/transferase [Candidatus Omnitrophica bacterium]|nr:sulfatase-like hydrolase/transferase [Candidatus Omnitrophota bacterium]
MTDKLNRRNFIRHSVGAGLGASLLSSTAALSNPAGRKTNLLFIITDQQRFDAMSCAGSSPLQTPNMDRIAKEGVRFTKAYTHCAVCGPARTSLLTGCAFSHTATPSNREAYDVAHGPNSPIRDLRTYDEILSDHGYHAEFFGKWHTPEMRAKCYKNPVTVAGQGRTVLGPGMRTHFLDFLERNQVPRRKAEPGEQIDTYSARPYKTDPIDKRHGMVPSEYYFNSKGERVKPIQPDLHGCLDVPAEFSITAQQAKETIDALERAKGKPFSITCSFHLPHAPMTPTKPYHGMHPLEEMRPSKSLNDSKENSPYKDSAKHHQAPEYSDPKLIRYMMSNYFGLIREIDDWIGKILQKLEAIGEADNTLVIFTSDHGEMLGAHGFREKNMFYEESAHIPLLMRLPGKIPAGRVVESPVSLLDLHATILDYLEAPPVSTDGESLRSLVDDPKATRDYVIGEWEQSTVPGYMVYDGRWKLMFGRTQDMPSLDGLYDLESDPLEIDNLIGHNPKRFDYEPQAERLKSMLVDWMAKVEDPNLESVKSRPVS